MKNLLIALCLLPLMSTAQDAGTDWNSTTIYGGATFSPDYCYRFLKPASDVKWIAQSRDSLEIPKFGFTTGVSALIKLNSKLSLETGIQYSDKGENTKKFTLIWITPSGQPDPAAPDQSSIAYHYIYIDLPFLLDYALLSKRFEFVASAGLSVNIFLHETNVISEYYSDGHTTSETLVSKPLSAVNPAVMAGVGIGYHISNYVFVKTEPIYRMSVLSIINAPIKGYLYSFGLSTTLYVAIK